MGAAGRPRRSKDQKNIRWKGLVKRLSGIFKDIAVDRFSTEQFFRSVSWNPRKTPPIESFFSEFAQKKSSRDVLLKRCPLNFRKIHTTHTRTFSCNETSDQRLTNSSGIGVFLWFCEIFKKNVFDRTPLVAASVCWPQA